MSQHLPLAPVCGVEREGTWADSDAWDLRFSTMIQIPRGQPKESMEMSWARKESEPAGNIMLYGIGQRLAKEGLPTKAQEPWHEKSL